ncbi:MAG: hypothetical protein JO276_16845 [Sphingomonadaceae bacterium]|nr:hypothetical protein [Sphingomonadaceae bacterium]
MRLALTLTLKRLRLLSLLSLAAFLPATARAADLAISLRRGLVDARPTLNVTIVNQSRNLVCIRKEALRNPYSGEMQVSLRDAFGSALPVPPSGFLDPPLQGAMRLRPGDSVRTYVFLDSRLPLPHHGSPFPDGMSARVIFRYGYCDDVWSWQAVSTRQRL